MASDWKKNFEDTYKKVECTFAKPLTERDKEVARVAFLFGRNKGIDDGMEFQRSLPPVRQNIENSVESGESES